MQTTDFIQYRLTDFSDSAWADAWKVKMGEEHFKAYEKQLYRLLNSLNVGETIVIARWCKPENYDLFVKLACIYVDESGGNYLFTNDFSGIKRHR